MHARTRTHTPGLDVAVQHVRRVDKGEPAKRLEQKVLDMLLGERLLGVDDAVQVRLHELHGIVEVRVLAACGGLEDREDGDDVVVFFEVFEQLQLAQSALCDCLDLKRMLDLLYCNLDP
jgi:hypothetical protein